MFGLGPSTKIYIAIEGVDMRKGFDGLYGLARNRLGQDPLSGHLFLFANQARSRLKVLVWDGSGLWVCAKRKRRVLHPVIAFSPKPPCVKRFIKRAQPGLFVGGNP